MALKAYACPRCLTLSAEMESGDGGCHTCTPTPFARGLELRVKELEAMVESMDCRLVGRVGELSGSHCPLEKPCDRCVAERRVAELTNACAVQGLAIEGLETRNKYMELRIRERDRYRNALNRILCETPGTTDCDFLYEIAREALGWTK